jgi:hypothetical protein
MCVPALVGEYWEKKDERAFSLVTIEPNAFVRTFHDRMIGQLSDKRLDTWLVPEDHGRDELWACLIAPPDAELVAYPLRADVGGAKFDDAAAMMAVGPAVTWADVQQRPAPNDPRDGNTAGTTGTTGRADAADPARDGVGGPRGKRRDPGQQTLGV